MSVKMEELIFELEKIAPSFLAEDWDNTGLSIGDIEKDVRKVLIALDVVDEVIEEAIDIGADFILTHHPFLLFKKINAITTEDYLGREIYKLIQNDISAYSMHTNLDIAEGGTNDLLADLIALSEIEILEETISKAGADKAFGIGRVGNLKEEVIFSDFANKIQEKLNDNNMRFVGDKDKIIKRVALCSGSGVSFLERAKEKSADLYITGDLKYHEAQKALEMDIAVADITHYASEVLIVPVLKSKLDKISEEKGWNIEVVISKINGQTFWSI